MADPDNLGHWEDLAAFHGTGNDGYYDIPALVAGRMSLRGLERAAVDIATEGRDVTGLAVAHVQSHIGIDTILLARLGANVTAFDFSPMAVQRLRELADECGVVVQAVVADSQELHTDAYARWHGRFDIVYATVGVISWIADLDAWMQGAAALLRPGGSLVLLELHPLLCMLESADPLVVDFPYVHDGVRQYEGTGSYANPAADLSWSIDQHAWSLGETVTAAVRAGLAVVRLEEHLEAPYDPRGEVLTREADGLFRLRLGAGAAGGSGASGAPARPAEPLPILFTLVAQRTQPLR